MKKPKTNKQLIVAALRRAWMMSVSRREALKACKHPSKTGWFICAYCKDEREKITVDHRPPVGALNDDLSNLTEYAIRMFEGKQFGSCKDCHGKLTKEDAKKQRALKRLNKKNED